MTDREIDDKLDLKLSDGRQLVLRRFGDFDWYFTMKDRRGKTIWKKTYRDQDLDVTWYDAFFVPVLPRRYHVDLNHDGNPEVAVAFWDGGNSGNAPVIIFTVKKAELTVFSRKYPFRFEMERYVYKKW